MANELSAEFESYRRTLPTEDKEAILRRKDKQLLELHGVDAWLCGRPKGEAMIGWHIWLAAIQTDRMGLIAAAGPVSRPLGLRPIAL